MEKATRSVGLGKTVGAWFITIHFLPFCSEHPNEHTLITLLAHYGPHVAKQLDIPV